MATATYTPIASQTLGSAAASITFSSIPGTYTDLRLVLTGATSVGGDALVLQFNADTATNYSSTILSGYGSSASSSSYLSTPSLRLWINYSSSTTIPGFVSVDLFSYAGSTNKTLLATTSDDQNGSGTVELIAGLWRSTSAITSIKVFLVNANNFNTGTIATLWGI